MFDFNTRLVVENPLTCATIVLQEHVGGMCVPSEFAISRSAIPIGKSTSRTIFSASIVLTHAVMREPYGYYLGGGHQILTGVENAKEDEARTFYAIRHVESGFRSLVQYQHMEVKDVISLVMDPAHILLKHRVVSRYTMYERFSIQIHHEKVSNALLSSLSWDDLCRSVHNFYVQVLQVHFCSFDVSELLLSFCIGRADWYYDSSYFHF